MILIELICATSTSFHLAANSKIQALDFLCCLGVGVVFGIFSLLYFRRSGKAETFVTDLFATLGLGLGYIGCLEFVFDGKFELYGLSAYVLGCLLIPCVFKLVLKIKRTNREKQNADS